MKPVKSTLVSVIALAASSGVALAECDQVTFSDVGWIRHHGDHRRDH